MNSVKETRGKLQQCAVPLRSSWQQKRAVTKLAPPRYVLSRNHVPAHTHTSLLELATTLDTDQQSSSKTELLFEGGSKEQMDVTELPVNSDSEGQVRTDFNSLTAVENLPKDFGIIYSCSNVANDFIAAIQRLTSTERYSSLKHHVVPPH